MCFDLDSRPPIAPIAGGALDSEHLTLACPDGNRFVAFRARAAVPSGAGMIVLPDVRGLHPYYEELALRFAEAGIDAIAIDYFGRTAGAERRGEDFDYMAHVPQTTWDGLQTDIRVAAGSLLGDDERRVSSLFTVGFCFGGRVAFLSLTMGLRELKGGIGFYGWPTGPSRNDTPAPAEVADQMRGALLGIFGGADQGISSQVVSEFERGLRAAGVDHRIVTYPGAPHSFFDRRAEDYADASADAWERVLGFVRERTPEA
jgi:carboxymethylenebutenolidase